MRKLLASLGVLVVASTASAQTIDPTPFARFIPGGDGTSESAWVVQNPTVASDWFNADLGGLVTGVTMGALMLDAQNDDAGSALSFVELIASGSDAAGSPDITTPIAAAGTASVPAGNALGDLQAYAVPCQTLGTDVHVSVNWGNGDTNLWVGADSSTPSVGRSYFTLNDYSSAQVPFGVNWSLSVGGFGPGVIGSMLINGQSSTTVKQSATKPFCLTFTACSGGVQSLLYLKFGLTTVRVNLPIPFTTTGNGSGPCANQWTICALADCGFPTNVAFGIPFEWFTFYLDPCDLKPGGGAKTKISTIANLFVDTNKVCSGCFGQRDDGVLDNTIWKVQNPAGASDWFNVDHGVTNATFSSVTSLTSVEIASWDFCGFGPSWQEIGIYPDNVAVPTVPDVTSPFSTASSLAMAGGAGDWTFPATLYDMADFAANTTTTYHAAARWPLNDTCIWMASDTDGIDSSCSTPISTGPYWSNFTVSDYSSALAPFTGAHWMMRINWN